MSATWTEPEQRPRPWTLTCTRPGCPGLMFRNRCASCGAER